MNLPTKLRSVEAGDVNYIISTWGKTLRRAYPEVRTGDFVQGLREYAARLMVDPLTRCLIAGSETDPTVIYGWAMGYDGTVVYAYTRAAYRRMGVCKRLLAEMGLSDLGALTVRGRLTDDAMAYKATHHVRVVPVF